MSKRAQLLIIVTIAIVLIASIILKISLSNSTPNPTQDKIPLEELEPQTLQEYSESIDYSCTTNEDCEIKDVHNCCGYFPKCTNQYAHTNPSLVQELCQQERLGGVCGFPSITACECIENKCEGV